ncbi:hypothetical protein NPIL_460301 [Nephila pilipes]|uniref:Uncharacterized protein n=1 Tax=Nephila pilipes TaxID=299642 RepID=A0A8X6N340_NEPPI|nr:hypothetical protein NPIL_460301 [Nephila pilipes]
MPFKLHEQMAYECMLVRDIIRYVLLVYWPDINWTPSGIFVDQDSDSPFNSIVQRSVKKYLDIYGWMINEKYYEHFNERKFSAKKHCEICREIIENQNNFADGRIVVFGLCSILSYITALSVSRGIRAAPRISHVLILGYFPILRNRGLIGDTFWEDFQNLCLEFSINHTGKD